MGTSSSHEAGPGRIDEGDYHIALVQDCKETAEAYIDQNRDMLKLASVAQPWWSNRLVHRAFMVKRKLVEMQRFLQRLGPKENFVRYRESVRTSQADFFAAPVKFSDEEKIAAALWHHSKTPKAIETAVETLELRVDEFLGLFQEEKLAQLI